MPEEFSEFVLLDATTVMSEQQPEQELWPHDMNIIHVHLTLTMKLSALALALVTAPIVGTAAQHVVALGGGGGGSTIKYKKMIRGANDLATKATTAGPLRPPALPLLNAAGDDDSDLVELMKMCMSLSPSGQSSCNANESCSWCLSGAVPSACYPTSMTFKLPAGVFQCDKDAEAVAEETPTSSAVDSKKVQTFNLKESITLTLSSSEVDKDFCDASSPLSLAGYMNGELNERFVMLNSDAIFRTHYLHNSDTAVT